MFFNEQGIIDIDELVLQEPSYQKIMADGIVTEEELYNQSQKVLSLLHETEERFSDSDQQLVKSLFAETSVLSAVYHYYSINSIR